MITTIVFHYSTNLLCCCYKNGHLSLVYGAGERFNFSQQQWNKIKVLFLKQALQFSLVTISIPLEIRTTKQRRARLSPFLYSPVQKMIESYECYSENQ